MACRWHVDGMSMAEMGEMGEMAEMGALLQDIEARDAIMGVAKSITVDTLQQEMEQGYHQDLVAAGMPSFDVASDSNGTSPLGKPFIRPDGRLWSRSSFPVRRGHGSRGWR